jgi:hypothetical protein
MGPPSLPDSCTRFCISKDTYAGGLQVYDIIKCTYAVEGGSKCMRFIHIKCTYAGGLQVYEIHIHIKCTYAGGLQVYEINCHIQRQRELERRCSVRGAG